MTYQLNQLIITKYKNKPCPKEHQYYPGQRVLVTAKDTKKRLALFEVIKSNSYRVVGRVITTYGNKRKAKQCAS